MVSGFVKPYAGAGELQKVINLVEKIDITNHILVPKFSKLTDEEKAKLLEDLNISSVQLPRILSKDPMAKLLKAKSGDVLKIERTNPTGKSVFYRRVE